MSRAYHDYVQSDRLVIANELEASRAEIRRLTDIIVEMRRDGFQPPAPHLEQVDLGPELTDEIAAAIQARSVTDEVARHLRVFAAQQLRANVEPKRIADAIWNGSDYDEDA